MFTLPSGCTEIRTESNFNPTEIKCEYKSYRDMRTKSAAVLTISEM